MTLIAQLAGVLGPAHVLTGADMARWATDWTGRHASRPLGVLRPGSTEEVAAILRLAQGARQPVVPLSGNTGLVGGGAAEGALVLSLDRMNRIREIRAESRLAVVEAGVILSDLHRAAEAQDLTFPVTFGARCSAMIGGILSTNAGGSNVLRHGNTRDLCLGLEAVLADGRVLNLMSELHKDNSGLALRHLLIGAEGTLGVITAATLKLRPAPRARATAFVAVAALGDALTLLHALQDATGGMVEAFEYLPARYMAAHGRLFPQIRLPFGGRHEVNILVELAATAPRDSLPRPDGSLPLTTLLEEVLAASPLVIDAEIAASGAQRATFWTIREHAAEVTFDRRPFIDTDVALPLDRVAEGLARIEARVRALDPAAGDMVVAHLGDGNLHYTVYPGEGTEEEAVRSAVEDVVQDMGGSFSAEHGIGLSKLGSMRRRKDPVALATMRAIKAALDPQGILNPGKVVPD